MLVISNRPRASRSSDFEITCAITPSIVLHSVELLLLIIIIMIMIMIMIMTMIIIIIKNFGIVVQERYQAIILARMEAFYSSISISVLLVFEFLISYFNACIFTD